MDAQFLHRFVARPSFFLNVCLIEGEPDTLGVLYKYIPADAPQHTYLTSFAILDIQQRISLASVTFNEHGPQHEPLSDALLCYDVAQKRWSIAERLGWEYIVLRTIHADDQNGLVLSPACLLDRDQFSDSGFPPLLDLECTDNSYRLLYHKPSEKEHRTAAIVIKQDLSFLAGWNRLKARVSAVSMGEVTALSWQQWLELSRQPQTSRASFDVLDSVLIPRQVSVDAGTTDVRQTQKLELVNRAEIAETENAMTLADRQTRLLILCSPETWVQPNDHPRTPAEIAQTGEQWRVWLTGWTRADLKYKWSYGANIGLPVDPDVPDYETPKPPAVEIAAIAGPETSGHQPTFVATIAMQGTEELFSQGVCLTHEGQVVQICDAALGRAPSLCLCQQVVIGVDRLTSGWRLWRWSVLDNSSLRNSLTLDPTCQRASVHAQADTNRFWLVEELPNGVRVSLRDAHTLAEVESPIFIRDVKLVEGSVDVPLEPHRSRGILPY
ncbi:MAG TPA: hypothetical protein VKX46_01010, partial [Ktedonobacteraceae bacterium]|nr:hypothetical protein [Ktedonobacteraceae bacterium]